MTYLKTTLIATALTAATGSIAFADGHKDGDHDMHDKMKTEKAMESKSTYNKDMKSETWNTDQMEASKVNDTAGEILQADGEPSIQSDREYVTYDGDQKVHGINPAAHSEISKEAVVVPGSNNSLTTVSCPEGTVAQADMTCMIKGQFDMENSLTTYMSNSDVAGAVEYNNWSGNYETDTEYKGTLRPDTVVVDNLED